MNTVVGNLIDPVFMDPDFRQDDAEPLTPARVRFN